MFSKKKKKLLFIGLSLYILHLIKLNKIKSNGTCSHFSIIDEIIQTTNKENNKEINEKQNIEIVKTNSLKILHSKEKRNCEKKK